MFEACPECGMKHLRAAVAYAASRSAAPGLPGEADISTATDSTVAMTSVAWVLFAESPSYPEHYDLAIGMLVRAEDNEAANGTWKPVGETVRRIRLADSSAAEKMRSLEDAGLVDPMVGHVLEAKREGGFAVPGTVNRKVVIEVFKGATKTGGSPEPEKGKEGE